MFYSASCRCGSVAITLGLPKPIESYQPRQCDCDFCVSHGLFYLSDENGTLQFHSSQTLNELKQGSQQASFLQCAQCAQIVAVTYQNNSEHRGAVCADLFSSQYQLQPAKTVSPKLLDAAEKPERWCVLWLKVIEGQASIS